MLLRKLCAVITLSLLFTVGHAEIVKAGQPPTGKHGPEVVTETFRVMGKGADHIVIGEQHLYVVPEITKITSRYGTDIELSRLRTPCLAEVTYSRWYQGAEKLPVVLRLKVKKVYRGASSENSQE
ncbi:MAG: hypothetical protein LJE87_08410 [Deltaproteobacteria bacterium]|jgi:hypothetical protein|nr:hypothetical protein [Deltaproteobacteria bacterium]